MRSYIDKALDEGSSAERALRIYQLTRGKEVVKISHLTLFTLHAAMLGKHYHYLVVGRGHLTTLMVNSEFEDYFDPYTAYETILSGRIGTIFGVTILTDGYFDPLDKVLDDNAVYLVPYDAHRDHPLPEEIETVTSSSRPLPFWKRWFSVRFQ